MKTQKTAASKTSQAKASAAVTMLYGLAKTYVALEGDPPDGKQVSFDVSAKTAATIQEIARAVQSTMGCSEELAMNTVINTVLRLGLGDLLKSANARTSAVIR